MLRTLESIERHRLFRQEMVYNYLGMYLLMGSFEIIMKKLKSRRHKEKKGRDPEAWHNTARYGIINDQRQPHLPYPPTPPSQVC